MHCTCIAVDSMYLKIEECIYMCGGRLSYAVETVVIYALTTSAPVSCTLCAVSGQHSAATISEISDLTWLSMDTGTLQYTCREVDRCTVFCD